MVTSRYLPEWGGVESHIREVSRRLVRLKVEVTVITTDPGLGLPARGSIDGVPVRRVPAWPRSPEARIAPGLASEIRRARADLIHVQHFHSIVAPQALIAARSSSVPAVVSFHGGGHRYWLRSRLWPPRASLLAPLSLDASAPLLRDAGGLVAVAQFEIDHLAPRIGVRRDRFSLIPNGCDPMAGRVECRAIDPVAPRLVSVGRLEEGKGHDKVIGALPHVIAQRPGATLWIAGAGPQEASLRDQARAAGVSDRVEILAFPPDERAAFVARLQTRDVLVSMSEFEAHPLSVIECLSLGLPAVVADTTGLRELAQRRLARAVPRNASPVELARAIIEEIDRPRPAAPPRFPTWDDCTGQLLALYRRIVVRPTPSRVG